MTFGDKIRTCAKCVFAGFLVRQDARIKLAQHAANAATERYVEAVEGGCSPKKRLKLFYAMRSVRGAYYGKVEQEILNCGRLRGAEYTRWVEEWMVSATKVLDGAIMYQALVRSERGKLSLPNTLFEPPDGAYRSIQAFHAAVSPTEATKMKARFVAANLPISGFDRPHKPEPAAERKPMPSRILALLIILALIVAFAVASHYVNPFVLAGIASVVVVLYVAVEIFDLRRGGKLKEKSLVELLKLILQKRFKFGGNDDNGPANGAEDVEKHHKDEGNEGENSKK